MCGYLPPTRSRTRCGIAKHRPDKLPVEKGGYLAVPHQVREQVPAPTVEMNERYRQTLLPYDPGMEELRRPMLLLRWGLLRLSCLKPGNLPAAGSVFPIRNAMGELVAFAARYREICLQRKSPNT